MIPLSLFLLACTACFVALIYWERAKYLKDDREIDLAGPELDRLGELLLCPRRTWGPLVERDHVYRVRLRGIVWGHAKRDTVRR